MGGCDWEVGEEVACTLQSCTCLVFNDDQSLLISGAEDGCVRIWSLFSIFNDEKREEARSLHEYSFHEHYLKVTDIKIGHGGCNAIIVSASEDRTCKVWGLSEQKLLRNIVFPSIIDAIVFGPGETIFYAGGRDGEIYFTGSRGTSSLGLRDHSKGCKAVTCLASSADGFRLVAGSEDGMIRVWNTKTWDSRVFRHTKGSVNNILVIRHTQFIFSLQKPKESRASSLKRHSLFLPPDPRPLKSMLVLQMKMPKLKFISVLTTILTNSLFPNTLVSKQWRIILKN